GGPALRSGPPANGWHPSGVPHQPSVEGALPDFPSSPPPAATDLPDTASQDDSPPLARMPDGPPPFLRPAVGGGAPGHRSGPGRPPAAAAPAARGWARR